MTVSKGKLLETLPNWGSLYTVEADIFFSKNSLKPDLINIFHFTQSANNGSYGSRIPAVFIWNGQFHICSGVSGNQSFCLQTNFYVGKKHHLKIQQFKSEEKKIYEVKINGKTLYSGENTDPKDFENVEAYVSDPWHDAFTSEYGVLENFKYYVLGKF